MIKSTGTLRYNQNPIRTCGKCSRLFLHVGINKRDNCEECHKVTAELMPAAMRQNRTNHVHPSHRLQIVCRECGKDAIVWGSSRSAGLYCTRKCAAVARARRRREQGRTLDAMVGGVQENSGKAVSAGVLKWLQVVRRAQVRAAMSFICRACGRQVRRNDLRGTRDNDICAMCSRDASIHASRAQRRALAPKSRKNKTFRMAIYNRDNWTCYLCGVTVEACKEYKPTQATLDHVTPLSKGGLDTEENCKTCCQACNSRKGGRTHKPGAMRILR